MVAAVACTQSWTVSLQKPLLKPRDHCQSGDLPLGHRGLDTALPPVSQVEADQCSFSGECDSENQGLLADREPHRVEDIKVRPGAQVSKSHSFCFF
jgi:hypothetical protein